MDSWWAELRGWERRHWLAAVVGGVLIGLLVAIPTAVIPTPIFGREVGVTWWSYPVVVASAVLGGLLAATYIADPPERADTGESRSSRLGLAGGVVAFLAVGCPVCNKLVLLTLGASGAMSWFAPIQPLLAIASVVLLAAALHIRIQRLASCDAAGTCDVPRPRP